MLSSLALRCAAIALAVAVSFGGAAAEVPPGALRWVLGANKLDLSSQYLGTASGGDGSGQSLAVTQPMGAKAIADGGDIGFAYFRVMAAGFGPSAPPPGGSPAQNELALWQSDPPAFWARLDRMFDDLDAHGVRIVPTFVWNPLQFPALANETLTQMVTDPHSRSQTLLRRYICEFIARYKARETILFYEFSNELNLEADIDIVARCLAATKRPDQCAAYGNFTTAQLNVFAAGIARFIRSHDRSRPIGSGYALPRAAAWHLARQPDFSAKGPDWTADSEGQFQAVLATTGAPFDLWSVHIYPGDVRWGNPAGTEYLTLDAASAAARQAGRRLCLGEFGDSTLSPFMTTMLARIAADGVAYASVWVWEFYQQSTWQSADITSAPATSLEPGFSDAIDAALARATGGANWADPGTPRLVLTAPAPCAAVNGPTELYAVASAAAPITHVTFSVDGREVGSTSMVPYHVPATFAGTGVHTITVAGYAPATIGWASEAVVVAPSTSPCALPAGTAQPGK
jgi:hypothetical protein